MSKDSINKKVKNVSGSFQVVDDSRKKDIAEMDSRTEELDEKSMYYARLFMEEWAKENKKQFLKYFKVKGARRRPDNGLCLVTFFHSNQWIYGIIPPIHDHFNLSLEVIQWSYIH